MRYLMSANFWKRRFCRQAAAHTSLKDVTSMLKIDILQRILSGGMVAIGRADTAEEALALSEACIAGTW